MEQMLYIHIIKFYSSYSQIRIMPLIDLSKQIPIVWNTYSDLHPPPIIEVFDGGISR